MKVQSFIVTVSFVFFVFLSAAQNLVQWNTLDTVVLGRFHKATKSDSLPFHAVSYYSYGQAIYYPSDVRRPMRITKVLLPVWGNGYESSDQATLYMGVTDSLDFSSDTSYFRLDSVGNMWFDGYGRFIREMIEFSVDFVYTGDKNLVIGYHETDDLYDSDYDNNVHYSQVFLTADGRTRSLLVYNSNPYTLPQIDPGNLLIDSLPHRYFTGVVPQYVLIGYPLLYEIDATVYDIFLDSVIPTGRYVPVDIIIRNEGTGTLTSAQIEWQMFNSDTTIASGTYSWSGSLGTMQTQTVRLAEVNTGVEGDFWFSVKIVVPGDQFPGNDSVTVPVKTHPGCKHLFALKGYSSFYFTGDLDLLVNGRIVYDNLEVLYDYSEKIYPFYASDNDTIVVRYDAKYDPDFQWYSAYWKIYDGRERLILADTNSTSEVYDTVFGACPLPFDPEMVAVLEPKTVVFYNDTVYPRVRIKNMGTDTLDSCTVNFVIADDTGKIVRYNVTQTFGNLNLPYQQELDLTFSEPYVAGLASDFVATAAIQMPGDGDTANNGAVSTFKVRTFDYQYKDYFYTLPDNATTNLVLYNIYDTGQSVSFAQTISIPGDYYDWFETMTFVGSDYDKGYLLAVTHYGKWYVISERGEGIYLGEIYDEQNGTLLSQGNVSYNPADGRIYYFEFYDYVVDPFNLTATRIDTLGIGYGGTFTAGGDIYYIDSYGYLEHLQFNPRSLTEVGYLGSGYFANVANAMYNDLYSDTLYLAANAGYTYTRFIAAVDKNTAQWDTVVTLANSTSAFAVIRSGKQVTLTVTDSVTGQPVGNASVRTGYMSFKTGADGKISHKFTYATYPYVVEARGYRQKSGYFTVNSNLDQVNIKLVPSASGITDLPQRVNVYPNPVRDFVFVDLQPPYYAEVYELTGKKVFSDFIYENQINVKNLPKGVYILHVVKNREVSTAKFVKQ